MTALLASGALAGVAASTAAAQAPAATPTTVTAVGTASVQVRRPAEPTDATIRAAVQAAQIAVGPKAVVAGRQEAVRLASALGLTLGALVSIEEQSGSFPFGPYGGADGTFGPGRYCGTTRRRIFRETADGRRVPSGRIRSRHSCRIPPSVSTSVAVTYLATPIA
jgi:hypothetical protein